MAPTKNPALSAYLFFAASVAFFAAAFIGHQVAFYGLGAMFVALGAGQYRRSRAGK